MSYDNKAVPKWLIYDVKFNKVKIDNFYTDSILYWY